MGSFVFLGHLAWQCYIDINESYILQNPNDTTILSGWRRIAFVEDFYDVIHGVHATSKGHNGTKKTIAEVEKLFECVPRSAIDKYVALCLVCHMQKPQTTRGPLKPNVSSGFMTRGQVNP